LIHEYPLVRSLDPHHCRIGYLGALAMVAVRSLDTNEALVSRFRDLLFARVHPDEPRFAELMGLVEPELESELRRRMERSSEEDPSAILSPPGKATGWLTFSEFWLYDRRLPSHVGYLHEKHASRTVDLARATGVLLPTLDLSEAGFLLQVLASKEMSLTGNPLVVKGSPALTLLYLRLIFGAEILFPYLIAEFAQRVQSRQPVSTRGEAGLLRGAARRLVETVGDPSDPEDVLAVSELREFEAAILKSRSTEDNYLRPRLEILVDLGLVERRQCDTTERPGAFPWTVPNGTISLASRLAPLLVEPLSLDEFLESQFIQVMGGALGLTLSPPPTEADSIRWFYRAYEMVHREIGFTPGRTVALLATLLAAQHGSLLEVRPLFDLVYKLPNSEFGRYISFSGGSRFDNEFMIKIDPEIEVLLSGRTAAAREGEN
jgi:hypothetical protein